MFWHQLKRCNSLEEIWRGDGSLGTFSDNFVALLMFPFWLTHAFLLFSMSFVFVVTKDKKFRSQRRSIDEI